MNTIKNYLENIFSNIPETLETLRAKEELLSMMEDKYNELKLEGKTENEAIGIVISEFGNIDEILESLDTSVKEPIEESTFSYTYDEEPIKTISLNNAKEIIKEQLDISKNIALGVFLCICSPILLIFLTGAAEEYSSYGNTAAAIGLVVLFLMIAIAILLFIIYGLKMEKIENFKKEPIILDYMTKEFIKKESENFKISFGKRIAFGVTLCIVSVIPIIITGTLFDNIFAQCASVSLLLIMVAFAVHIFIVTGMTDSTYKMFLEKESDSTPHGHYKEYNSEDYNYSHHYESPLTRNIASIYWPVITIIYLFWSFVYGSWGTSWIIWPIAGLLFGVISNICRNFETKKKI
ncbi:MAG: permease prefix domain 1-containing protein [Sarcina sp.]